MDSNETIKQAVMAGLGIAMISQHTVTEELRSRRVQQMRLGEPCRIDLVECDQSCVGAVGEADRGGPVERDHRARVDLGE